MTEKHKTGLPGLHNLHKTLDAATEVIATFISVTRSDEKAPESLIEAADKAVIDLAGWPGHNETTNGLAEIAGRDIRDRLARDTTRHC